jgi:malonate transporter
VRAVSAILFGKLLAIFAIIGVGWGVGRTRILGADAAAAIGRATFTVFAPALLFRTMAGIDIANLPWTTLAAYFSPTLVMLLATYAFERRRRRGAAPTIRSLSMSFSNTVQVGIPVVAALFGTAGLAIHIGFVSLQALVLLTTATILAEKDLARDGQNGVLATAATTARRAIVHPVVLPVLLGLAYNVTGLGLPGPVDDVLTTMGAAVVPLSLITIGLTLQLNGVAGHVRPAIVLSVGKLLVQPAVVLLVAYWGFGLRGLPLVVAVLCAALPIGANVLLFAQRYEELEAETTAAIVASTSAYLVTSALWLLALSAITTV